MTSPVLDPGAVALPQWQAAARERVHAAMVEAGLGEPRPGELMSRAERYARCGSASEWRWVEGPEGPKRRVVLYRCGDLLCPACHPFQVRATRAQLDERLSRMVDPVAIPSSGVVVEVHAEPGARVRHVALLRCDERGTVGAERRCPVCSGSGRLRSAGVRRAQCWACEGRGAFWGRVVELPRARRVESVAVRPRDRVETAESLWRLRQAEHGEAWHGPVRDGLVRRRLGRSGYQELGSHIAAVRRTLAMLTITTRERWRVDELRESIELVRDVVRRVVGSGSGSSDIGRRRVRGAFSAVETHWSGPPESAEATWTRCERCEGRGAHWPGGVRTVCWACEGKGRHCAPQRRRGDEDADGGRWATHAHVLCDLESYWPHGQLDPANREAECRDALCGPSGSLMRWDPDAGQWRPVGRRGLPEPAGLGSLDPAAYAAASAAGELYGRARGLCAACDAAVRRETGRQSSTRATIREAEAEALRLSDAAEVKKATRRAAAARERLAEQSERLAAVRQGCGRSVAIVDVVRAAYIAATRERLDLAAGGEVSGPVRGAYVVDIREASGPRAAVEVTKYVTKTMTAAGPALRALVLDLHGFKRYAWHGSWHASSTETRERVAAAPEPVEVESPVWAGWTTAALRRYRQSGDPSDLVAGQRGDGALGLRLMSEHGAAGLAAMAEEDLARSARARDERFRAWEQARELRRKLADHAHFHGQPGL